MGRRCEELVDLGTSPDLSKGVHKIADSKGAHGVFLPASSTAAYRVAPRMRRIGGCAVCVDMPAAVSALAGDDSRYLVLNNLHIVGSLTGSRQDTANALSMDARSLLLKTL
ncbi:hypothetical protein BDV28DRAFT_128761 [Aspergillus coremiiformis]|uniref:Uncharacterized protein n=1 Tax=Aspergillus coremiiformis TaxID=138285 RepID=A0A5N6ZDP6_9EURO|nr:hypothetical protein BDV28DRAFT_128761 [Aspergillus coremiiformis]